MLSGSWLEPIGIVSFAAFLPLHTMTLLWLWRRRKRFPINGRFHSLTIILMILWTPIIAYLGVVFTKWQVDIPCYLIWFYGPLLTIFIPITTIRACMFLTQNEITADLAIAEHIRARNKYATSQADVTAPAPHTNGIANGTGDSPEPVPTLNTDSAPVAVAAAGATISSPVSPPPPPNIAPAVPLVSVPVPVLPPPLASAGTVVSIQSTDSHIMVGGNSGSGPTTPSTPVRPVHIVMNSSSHQSRQPQHTAGAATNDELQQVAPRAFVPSFFNRHRHWFRGRNLQRIFILLTIAYFLLALSTVPLLDGQGACDANDSLWSLRRINQLVQTLILIPFGLILLPVLYRLFTRFEHDAYGMMHEMKYSGVMAVLAIPVIWITSPAALPKQDTYILLIHACIYIIVWSASCLHPLYQSYVHEDIMSVKMDMLTKSTQLVDLLLVPEGYEAFLSFCRSELQSEAVLFFRRIMDFRDISRTRHLLHATASHTTTNHNGHHHGNRRHSSHRSHHHHRVHHVPIILTPQQAQGHLCTALIESERIWCDYIAPNAPNELHQLSAVMRVRVRAALDNLEMRAATQGNLLIAPSTIASPAMTPPAPVTNTTTESTTTSSTKPSSQPMHGSITRYGITISTQLDVDDCKELEIETRNVYNQCSDTIIQSLQANSFARFKVSEAFQSLIDGLRARPSTVAAAHGHTNHNNTAATGGATNGNGSNGHANDRRRSSVPYATRRRSTGAPIGGIVIMPTISSGPGSDADNVASHDHVTAGGAYSVAVGGANEPISSNPSNYHTESDDGTNHHGQSAVATPQHASQPHHHGDSDQYEPPTPASVLIPLGGGNGLASMHHSSHSTPLIFGREINWSAPSGVRSIGGGGSGGIHSPHTPITPAGGDQQGVLSMSSTHHHHSSGGGGGMALGGGLMFSTPSLTSTTLGFGGRALAGNLMSPYTPSINHRLTLPSGTNLSQLAPLRGLTPNSSQPASVAPTPKHGPSLSLQNGQQGSLHHLRLPSSPPLSSMTIGTHVNPKLLMLPSLVTASVEPSPTNGIMALDTLSPVATPVFPTPDIITDDDSSSPIVGGGDTIATIPSSLQQSSSLTLAAPPLPPPPHGIGGVRRHSRRGSSSLALVSSHVSSLPIPMITPASGGGGHNDTGSGSHRDDVTTMLEAQQPPDPSSVVLLPNMIAD